MSTSASSRNNFASLIRRFINPPSLFFLTSGPPSFIHTQPGPARRREARGVLLALAPEPFAPVVADEGGERERQQPCAQHAEDAAGDDRGAHPVEARDDPGPRVAQQRPRRVAHHLYPRE